MFKIKIKGKEEAVYQFPDLVCEAVDVKHNCGEFCKPAEIVEVTIFLAGGEEDG